MAAARRPSIGPFSPPRLRARGGEAWPRFWRPCRQSASMRISMRISSGSTRAGARAAFLIDTNVISEANRGVVEFFEEADSGDLVFLSSITVGELRRGVDLIRRRGGADQAERLEAWLKSVVDEFGERILPLDAN